MAQQLRGIIWDLDGTLADTLRDIADAANVALASAGLPPKPTNEYRRLVGSGRRALIQRASGLTDPEAIRRMEQAFDRHYRDHGMDHTRLYDGVGDVLSHFARDGVPMAVLSNKPHEYTMILVEALLGEWRFAGVLGQQDALPRKPDPAAALKLVALMQLPPAQVALVGDAEIDMVTAHRAGLFPIGVTWGFRDGQELEQAGAGKIISRPAELIALVGTRG